MTCRKQRDEQSQHDPDPIDPMDPADEDDDDDEEDEQDETVPTVSPDPECPFEAWFSIKLEWKIRTSLAPATTTKRFVEAQPAIVLDQHGTAAGSVSVKTQVITRYPGTLLLQWKLGTTNEWEDEANNEVNLTGNDAGEPISADDINQKLDQLHRSVTGDPAVAGQNRVVEFILVGARIKRVHSVEIHAQDRQTLEQAMLAMNQLFLDEKWGFVVRAPDELKKRADDNKTVEDVSQWLLGRVSWHVEDEECGHCLEPVMLRWHYAVGLTEYDDNGPRPEGDWPIFHTAMPREVILIDEDEEDEEEDEEKEKKEYTVSPVLLQWPIDDPLACCEDCSSTYQVIQFTRALIASNNGDLRTGHKWSLDILDTQKKLAGRGRPFDPTFTTVPIGSKNHGEVANARVSIGGHVDDDTVPVINQTDAPGPPSSLYDQLRTDGQSSQIHFQFIAFLVCAPEIAGGENPAEAYLDRAKLLAVTIFDVLTVLEGDAEQGTVVAEVRWRKNFFEEREYILCQPVLRKILEDNELLDAYLSPQLSTTRPMAKADAKELLQDMRGFDDLELPTRREVRALTEIE